ncbi:hypothetical protein GCM10009844_05860 [Nocardioides koreensis]|uniref:Uncharacterized protein n=1 Tax=Nocardioides koreensis TaxID=433651 RepID=A0ABN2Z7X1_9ACTN
MFALVHRSHAAPKAVGQTVCSNCNHAAHRALKNPVTRLYEHVHPPTNCQVWVDRTTWWDGELCRCPDPVHRS